MQLFFSLEYLRISTRLVGVSLVVQIRLLPLPPLFFPFRPPPSKGYAFLLRPNVYYDNLWRKGDLQCWDIWILYKETRWVLSLPCFLSLASSERIISDYVTVTCTILPFHRLLSPFCLPPSGLFVWEVPNVVEQSDSFLLAEVSKAHLLCSLSSLFYNFIPSTHIIELFQVVQVIWWVKISSKTSDIPGKFFDFFKGYVYLFQSINEAWWKI